MKRKRIAIFALTSLLTIGALNYKDFEDKAVATEDSNSYKKAEIQTKVVPRPQSNKQVDPVDLAKEKTVVHTTNRNQISQTNTEQDTQPLAETSVKKEPVAAEKQMPATKTIDGYTYVNLMDTKEENLADLIAVAKKHNATLYAIEFSDCFVMYDNKTDEPVILFSTGSRSVAVENVGVLYDMHPSIKEQIKTVVDTGEEKIVEVSEFESYHISKSDGRIFLSF